MASGDSLKDTLLLYRSIEQQYKLDQYTTEALKQIQRSLDIARESLFDEISYRDIALPKGRADMVLEELNNLTFAIQNKLSNDILNATIVAGEYSYKEYETILSFDGAIDETVGFNHVSVSPDQIRAMVTTVPVGGKLLEGWVKDTFELRIQEEIQTAILADTLQGLSTPKIIRHMESAFGMIRNDAETLVRTYIQSINNQAAEAVYKANSDIIKQEEWCATLEVGLSGKSTCLRCASLDKKTFDINSEHVRPPLHLKCRCFMIPKTLSYRELGLNIPEMKESLRPYSERSDKRAIVDAGQFDGDFEKFLFSRDQKYQLDLLGPNRLRLINEGKIKFADLVDKDGNTRLLKKDKDGNYVGLID